MKSINTAAILPIFENDEFQALFKEFESRQMDNVQFRWISIYIRMVEKWMLHLPNLRGDFAYDYQYR